MLSENGIFEGNSILAYGFPPGPVLVYRWEHLFFFHIFHRKGRLIATRLPISVRLDSRWNLFGRKGKKESTLDLDREKLLQKGIQK